MKQELSENVQTLSQELKGQPDWESRYYLILQLAKQSPFNIELQQEKYAVSGCQAKVWIKIIATKGGYEILSTSDSRLVRGLLFILTAPLQNKAASYICEFDAHEWLQSCGLAAHLNPSRVNGLLAVLNRIHEELGCEH